MKKLIAALAVLTVAAVAQAELLATWEGATVDNKKAQDAEMSGLFAIDGATTSTSGVFGKLLMNDTDEDEIADAQGAFGFTVTVPDGGSLADALLSGSTTGSATGPGKVFVTGGSKDAEFTRNRTGQFQNLDLGTIASGSTIKFTADIAANGGTARSSTETFTNTSGTLGIKTMSLDATVVPGGGSTSVPEPATMSLLGLGALAMVLRRKLRK